MFHNLQAVSHIFMELLLKAHMLHYYSTWSKCFALRRMQLLIDFFYTAFIIFISKSRQ